MELPGVAGARRVVLYSHEYSTVERFVVCTHEDYTKFIPACW